MSAKSCSIIGPCTDNLGTTTNNTATHNNGNRDHDSNICSIVMDQSSWPKVLSVLSSLLERMVAKNEEERSRASSTSCTDNYSTECCNGNQCNAIARIRPNHVDRLTVFHGLCAPSISVEKYMERIFKYANCSPSCFVVAYAYLDRFVRSQVQVLDSPIIITSLNIHRLLITSVMVAAKFLDDSYYNNAYYAKVGGVSTHEMNRLELEFLFRLGFRLHLTLDTFHAYCAHLHANDGHGPLAVLLHASESHEKRSGTEGEDVTNEEDTEPTVSVASRPPMNVRHVTTGPSVKRQQPAISINNHLMEPVS